MHHRAAPRPRAPLVVQDGQLWAKPEAPVVEEPMSANEVVRLNLNTILMRHVVGDTLEEIGAALKPMPLTGLQIRQIMMADRELRVRLEAVLEHRAHHFFELAGRQAILDKDGAAMMRVAERMLPKVYGPKAETTIVASVKVEGELTVKQEPSEAYLAMVRGNA